MILELELLFWCFRISILYNCFEDKFGSFSISMYSVYYNIDNIIIVYVCTVYKLSYFIFLIPATMLKMSESGT